MEPSSFDPSLPSIRLLQTWIREQKILSLELSDGRRLIGVLIWQDQYCLALQPSDSDDPVLISRAAMLLVRPLPRGL
jgi:host factor-I protein